MLPPPEDQAMPEEDGTTQSSTPLDFEPEDEMIHLGSRQYWNALGGFESPPEIDPAAVDPRSELDNLSSSSMARGCMECRKHDQDCSMILTGKLPCAQCIDYDTECQPFPDTKMTPDDAMNLGDGFPEPGDTSHEQATNPTGLDGGSHYVNDLSANVTTELAQATPGTHSMYRSDTGVGTTYQYSIEVNIENSQRQIFMSSSDGQHERAFLSPGHPVADPDVDLDWPSFVPGYSQQEQEGCHFHSNDASMQRAGPGIGLRVLREDPWSPESVSYPFAPPQSIEPHWSSARSSATGQTSSQDPFSAPQGRTPSTYESSLATGEGGLEDSIMTLRENHSVNSRSSDMMETDRHSWNSAQGSYPPQIFGTYPDIVDRPMLDRFLHPIVQQGSSWQDGHNININHSR
jgi:hypothetical protein